MRPASSPFLDDNTRDTRLGFRSTRPLLAAGLALGLLSAGATTACSDDSNSPDNGAAGSSSSAGTGNQAGADGAAQAGNDGAGAAGAAGAGGGASTFDVLEVADHVVTSANDLRGLTYAANGKIYASGHSSADPENPELVLARFDADGTLDEDFGVGGIVLFDVAAGQEQSLGIVELADGELIVQANVADGNGGENTADQAGGDDMARPGGTNVVLLRFTSDGRLVTSFGTDGVALIEFGWPSASDAEWPAPTYDSSESGNSQWSWPGYPHDQSWGIALDNSGEEERIVVFGYGPAKVGELDDGVQRLDNDRYIVRVLASTGEPDPSFNEGEPLALNTLGTFSDGGRRGIVERDGSIVSAGYTNFGDGFGNHVVLVRLNPDGTLDQEFGFGIPLPGTARFNPFLDDGGMTEAYDVGQQSSGRYVTTGYGRATGTDMPSSYGYATTDGVDLVSFGVTSTGLDSAYGRTGTLAVQSEEHGLASTEDRGRALVVLPNDHAVHAGRFGGDAALIVTTPDGELAAVGPDAGGVFRFPHDTIDSHFYAIALSPDGTRVAATTNNHDEGVRIAVLRVELE